jgi:hypothetical protein
VKLFLSYRYLIAIFIIFAGNIAAAQDSATVKFLDSLKTPAPSNTAVTDSVAAKDTEVDSTDSVVGSTEDTMPVDTSIISNMRPIRWDSLALIKRDKGFYYQNWLDSLLRAEESRLKNREKPEKINLPNLDGFFTVFKLVLWVLASAVLIFILYKLFLGKTALFIKNRKNIDAVINIEEQPVAGEYDGLIKKAEAENNYRLAVRYMQLRALYNLSDKGYIVRDSGKTNYQYINELRKRNPAFANLFSALTFKYEYIWYGEYPVDESMYNTMRDSFDQFENEIR